MAVDAEWLPLLEQARAERANVWDHVMEAARESGEELPANIEEIGELYRDIRIDFPRIQTALENGGDLSSITIDPRPEDAPAEDTTVLDAYFVHLKTVVDETCKANGLKAIDLSIAAHSDLVNETEERLLLEGISINPLY